MNLWRNMHREKEKNSMQKKSPNKRKAKIHCQGVWSGYNESYVKNIVKGAMKALTLLSVLTFDPGLLFWTKGLENHLKNRMKEAEKEAEEAKKYRF